MPSNEGHVHWGGSSNETVGYLDQVLLITVGDDQGDPIGTIEIRADGFVGSGLFLPNSSERTPVWDDVPGTSPLLQVRQDGHYPTSYIRIRAK